MDIALRLDFSNALVDHFVVIAGGHFKFSAFRSGEDTHHQAHRNDGRHTLGDLFAHVRFFFFKEIKK